MEKVVITTTVENAMAVTDSFDSWAKSVGLSDPGDAVEIKVPYRNIIIKRLDSKTVLSLDFDGGYTSDKGFTYEFSLFDTDMKMVFKGNERDYGYGDIRQILSGCKVSEIVEMSNITVISKAWPA